MGIFLRVLMKILSGSVARLVARIPITKRSRTLLSIIRTWRAGGSHMVGKRKTIVR
jgi:hypothetical protein